MTAFTRPSVKDLITRNIAEISARLPDADASTPQSNLNVLSHVLAGGFHGLYGALDVLAKNVMLDTCNEAYVLRFSNFYGVERLRARKSQGQATFTGNEGALILAGTQIKAGELIFQTTQDAVIQSAGNVTVMIESVASGQSQNIASTTMQLVNPITSINAEVITTQTEGGVNIESIEALRARVLLQLQTPPRGGTPSDYIFWAKSANPAVTRVWVYPNELALGTVTLRIVTDHADSLIADQILLDEVKDYIEQKRPVGSAELFVTTPSLRLCDFEIELKVADTQAIREEITQNLSDLLSLSQAPGATVLYNDIIQTISSSEGEVNHTLHQPTADITTQTGELPVLGEIIWRTSS